MHFLSTATSTAPHSTQAFQRGARTQYEYLDADASCEWIRFCARRFFKMSLFYIGADLTGLVRAFEWICTPKERLL